jgi:hypothetical protein
MGVKIKLSPLYIYRTLCFGGKFWFLLPRPLMNVNIGAAHVTMSFVSEAREEGGVFVGFTPFTPHTHTP